MNRPVVVGIDDIELSARAVANAAREARLRAAPLWIAHAYHWVSPVAVGMMPGNDSPEGAVRDAATALLAQAVTRTRAEYPDLDIHDYAMSGQPGPALADLAKDAALLVVGGRGRGGFAGLLLGSVALRAVAHARCPVLVVRGESDAESAQARGRVLVGVDVLAPTTGADVLGFAFEEAALHGYGLCAVHAWEDSGYLYPAALGHHPRETLDAVNAERLRSLDSLVAPWRDKHPDTLIETRVRTGPPGEQLVDASRTADLLVLGGLRSPSGPGIRLGGLAHAVLHHAHCPVAIVPEG